MKSLSAIRFLAANLLTIAASNFLVLPVTAQTLECTARSASSPVSGRYPQIVQNGDFRVTGTGKGRNWKVVFSPTIAMRSSETETLSVSVSANSTPFASLDTNPETIAWRPLNEADWKGFERGADRRHKLRFKPAKPAVLKVKVDGVSAQIELR